MSTNDWLHALGRGDSIESVCRRHGWTDEEFRTRWQDAVRQHAERSPEIPPAPLAATATIERDPWGVPHLFADNDQDLFFAYGVAMAQDRLFQLDYLRRKATGRLSEILGPTGFELDRVARTIGFHQIAAREWQTLRDDIRTLVEAFSRGINHWIAAIGNHLPIEFTLLDIEMQPWTPQDCLAIESEFRWYLTGRMPVILIPELAKRKLGDGPLWHDFLLGEADEESILHPEEYATTTAPDRLEPVGQALNDPDANIGSNNWVVGGQNSETDRPFVFSDPHIAIEAVSCWYQAHLCGGSFNVAGMTYAGMPCIMFGRNERVAWGITNNICSQRDLYQETIDDEHPDCFLFDGRWEEARHRREEIRVRDEDEVVLDVVSSRNGPIVDSLLPSIASRLGPVSIRWLGAHHGGWLTSLLDMDRASDGVEFETRLRPWHVPTFSLVFADLDGNIGFKTSGRIPQRRQAPLGFRRGDDPSDQWQGLLPFEQMPGVINPTRGWVATANNRVAADDFAYGLHGCWSSGWRAKRIRELIEAQPRHSRESLRAIQQDVYSFRAARAVPTILEATESLAAPDVQAARTELQDWDYHVTPESTGATVFNVFFSMWCSRVAEERFPDKEERQVIEPGIAGCAARLLESDPNAWFDGGEQDRLAAVRSTFTAAAATLSERLGNDVQQWHWGRLHKTPMTHFLSTRGDLGRLLDQAGAAVRGDMGTVCNSGSGPDWTATTGAGYRMMADLSTQPAELHAIDAPSQSGVPGSPHYDDQYDDWKQGQYHAIPLSAEEAHQAAVSIETIRSSL